MGELQKVILEALRWFPQLEKQWVLSQVWWWEPICTLTYMPFRFIFKMFFNTWFDGRRSWSSGFCLWLGGFSLSMSKDGIPCARRTFSKVFCFRRGSWRKSSLKFSGRLLNCFRSGSCLRSGTASPLTSSWINLWLMEALTRKVSGRCLLHFVQTGKA